MWIDGRTRLRQRASSPALVDFIQRFRRPQPPSGIARRKLPGNGDTSATSKGFEYVLPDKVGGSLQLPARGCWADLRDEGGKGSAGSPLEEERGGRLEVTRKNTGRLSAPSAT